MNESTESTIESAAAFSTTLPPGGLYIGTALRQRVDLIEHLLEFGHQMILLCGAPASGKTTLLGSLAADAGSRWQCVDVRGGAALSGRALLETVAEAAGMNPEPTDDDATLLERVRQRAAQTERAGRLLVVLLDDADRLSPDAISTLLALARHDDAGSEPRVLMTADQDHAALLSSLQRDEPNRALVHVIEIPPLNDAQVEAFLGQRARAVGLALEDCLGDDALATIAAEGEGNPGKVLALARQAVGGQLLPRKAASTGGFLARLGAVGGLASRRSLLVGAGVLGAGVLGALLWLGRPVKDLPPAAAEEGIAEPAAKAGEEGRQRIEISLPGNTDAPADEAPGAPAVLPQSQANAGGTEGPEPAAAAATRLDPSSQAMPAQTPGVEDPAPSPVPVPLPDTTPEPASRAAVPEAALPAAAAGVAAGAAAVTASKPQPAPGAPKQPASTRQEKAAAKPAAPATARNGAAEKPASKPKAVAGEPAPKRATAAPKPERSTRAAPVAQSRTNGSKAAAERATPASGYTLQLIGVRERSAASEFIRKHQLSKGARIIESRRNGQPWFTVAFGSYPSRAAANAGIEALPASVKRATTPWVRAVNGRQKATK